MEKMEKTRIQRYAESLDKVIQNNHIYLKETVKDFQEKCLLTSSVQTMSKQVAGEIQDTHQEIQQRLKEIKAIQQLLKTKYLIYIRRDSVRDREVTEFEQTAKQCYSRFEYSLRQIMEKEKPKHARPSSRTEVKGGPFQWFRARENQVMLLRNLRILSELDYEISPSRVEEKRQIDHDKPRGLTLFVFKGSPEFIDDLQSRMHLREHDILERQSREELRGALTHLREIHPLEVEKIFQRYQGSLGFSELKCLLLPIRPEKGLDGNLVSLVDKFLKDMGHGEVKTLLIWEASLEPLKRV